VGEGEGAGEEGGRIAETAPMLVISEGCRPFGNKSSFRISLPGYRSHQNLRCSKSNAIFQN
jgi:hypothetical protein